jgi:hypothetical protein
LGFLDELENFCCEQHSCVDLLRAMELDDDTEGVTVQGVDQDDEEEACQLPTEWIDILKSQKSNLEVNGVPNKGSDEGENGSQSTQPTSDDLAKAGTQEDNGVKTEKAKKQWGPVLAQRKCKRFSEDNRTALHKAQDFKK